MIFNIMDDYVKKCPLIQANLMQKCFKLRNYDKGQYFESFIEEDNQYIGQICMIAGDINHIEEVLQTKEKYSTRTEAMIKAINMFFDTYPLSDYHE